MGLAQQRQPKIPHLIRDLAELRGDLGALGGDRRPIVNLAMLAVHRDRGRCYSDGVMGSDKERPHHTKQKG